MSSVNKVILIGNLGQDPEMRHTQNSTAVTNFRIATNETWQKNGRKHEDTEWHRIVTFGKLAEIVNQWASKGDKLYVEGRIQTRKWEDKDGNPRYTTEIVARDVRFLTPKDKSPSGATADDIPPMPDSTGNDIPF